jgi:hypothetical protein
MVELLEYDRVGGKFMLWGQNNEGDWVCVAHGRWTRGVEIEDASGMKTIRKIDPDDILLVSDTSPSDDTLSDAVQVEQNTR